MNALKQSVEDYTATSEQNNFLKLWHLASVLSVGERSTDMSSCSVTIFSTLIVAVCSDLAITALNHLQLMKTKSFKMVF